MFAHLEAEDVSISVSSADVSGYLMQLKDFVKRLFRVVWET